MADQTKTSADAASPGPLENEKQWKHWEEKFVNYTNPTLEQMVYHYHMLLERINYQMLMGIILIS